MRALSRIVGLLSHNVTRQRHSAPANFPFVLGASGAIQPQDVRSLCTASLEIERKVPAAADGLLERHKSLVELRQGLNAYATHHRTPV